MSAWMRAQASRFQRGLVKSMRVSKGITAMAFAPPMELRD
jgi:hypothetical protein